MVVFGEILDGREAERVGLVWRCVPDDELLDAAIALAAKAASAPPALSARVRETMSAVSALVDHEAAVDAELEAQVWSLDQPDFQERLAAMQQRISAKPAPQ